MTSKVVDVTLKVAEMVIGEVRDDQGSVGKGNVIR